MKITKERIDFISKYYTDILEKTLWESFKIKMQLKKACIFNFIINYKYNVVIHVQHAHNKYIDIDLANNEREQLFYKIVIYEIKNSIPQRKYTTIPPYNKRNTFKRMWVVSKFIKHLKDRNITIDEFIYPINQQLINMI